MMPNFKKEEDGIEVCTSVEEFNDLLSSNRPSNSVKIAGMYNSLVDRILIDRNGSNQGLNSHNFNFFISNKIFVYIFIYFLFSISKVILRFFRALHDSD